MRVYRVLSAEKEYQYPENLGYWEDELDALRAAHDRQLELNEQTPIVGEWKLREASIQTSGGSWSLEKIIPHWVWEPLGFRPDGINYKIHPAGPIAMYIEEIAVKPATTKRYAPVGIVVGASTKPGELVYYRNRTE